MRTKLKHGTWVLAVAAGIGLTGGAVQAVAAKRMEDDNIHVGPSDYVPWQKDNKICFIRMEGQLFGDVPMDIELRLSVEDSPNSAGVAIDIWTAIAMGTPPQLMRPISSPAIRE